MKKLFFFVSILIATTSFAAVTYELNGGVTNDYGWQTKNDMFQACMADCGVSSLGSLEEVKASADPYSTICAKLTDVSGMLCAEKWDWLEAYIMTVQNFDAAATALAEGTTSAGWRYAVAAFFLESQRIHWPKSADFSIAGIVEAFQPYWKHGFANPTEPTVEFVLNAPYYEGKTFDGWYTTADFSGEKVTKIDATANYGYQFSQWNDGNTENPRVVQATEDKTYTAYFYKKTAYDFEVEGICYNITNSSEPYTVEVTCQYEYTSNNYADWTSISIPTTVTYNGITYAVTSIGNEAFWCSSSLTSITIPQSITSIGDYAFGNCSSLTFITIPNRVTNIGKSAFLGCSSLTSITIPNSVTSIGVGIFAGCKALTSISIKSANPYYDSRDNCNAIIEKATNTLIAGCQNTIIPNSVTSIEDYALSSIPITSITIPNGVTSIGKRAFSSCSSLTSITIPNSVTNIGQEAFLDCYSLASIKVETGNSNYDSRDNCNAIIHTATNTLIQGCQNTIIPNSVTSIGDGAFASCFRLKSITIPKSVTNIGKNAFSYCDSLSTITISSKNPIYDSRDYCNAIIETATNTLIAGCSNTIIPKSITSIGDEAFIGSRTLKSISIPDNVKHIGKKAFYWCRNLEFVKLPNYIDKIEEFTFIGCSSLTSIVIPNSVKEIGTYAFAHGYQQAFALDSVLCYSTTPPTIDSTTFYDISLYVPCEVVTDYETHPIWGKFINIQCIASERVETEQVETVPATNSVTITWPMEDNADTYTIVIKKEDEIVSTLNFDSDGRLLNIAYAPTRGENNHPAQYAEQVDNGGVSIYRSRFGGWYGLYL